MNARKATEGVALTTDLSHEEAFPYFLWDQPMTVAELRRRLNRSPEERLRMLGTILREAREPDVWLFTTPQEVAREWKQIEPHLGRRRAFWEFLMSSWREQGLLE
jgi:hypothetical protein